LFRGWESLGARDSKQVVAWQLVLGLGATYSMVRTAGEITTTVELRTTWTTRASSTSGASSAPGRTISAKVGGAL
jgi:hypothetical protein